MTIERLEQYADLRREVAMLRKRVAVLERQASTRVCDTVKAPFAEYPYTEHTVTVRGYSKKRAEHLNSVICNLAQRELLLSIDLRETEVWLNTVHDSNTRQLIELFYIDGKSWESTASAVYGHPYADAARMRVK